MSKKVNYLYFKVLLQYEMVKDLKQKLRSESVRIDLPIKRFSALSHLDNIDYCIEQIKNCSGNGSNSVVGYILEMGWGTREALHRILPKKDAEDLKKSNSRFDYITLEDFLKEKVDIEKGKYIVRKGLIINYNPFYTH